MAEERTFSAKKDILTKKYLINNLCSYLKRELIRAPFFYFWRTSGKDENGQQGSRL